MATRDRKVVPPWGFVFSSGMPCLFCGNAERVLVVSDQRDDVGVCEACVVNLHWVWRQYPGDALPEATDSVQRVSRVKVLVTRQRRLASGEMAPAELPESYEVAMVTQANGCLDLPSAELRPGETEIQGAARALDEAGVLSWPIFLESLYAAHTPRGSVARLYVARAVSVSQAGSDLTWRKWGPWEHAPASAGFYLALRDVWKIRLASHLAGKNAAASITILVRKGAVEYIRMQQDLRAGQSEVDTSMAEYLRKAMTDDEKWVDKMLREFDEKTADQRAEPKDEPKVEPEVIAAEALTNFDDLEVPTEEGEEEGAEESDESVEDEVDFG